MLHGAHEFTLQHAQHAKRGLFAGSRALALSGPSVDGRGQQHARAAHSSAVQHHLSERGVVQAGEQEEAAHAHSWIPDVECAPAQQQDNRVNALGTYENDQSV